MKLNLKNSISLIIYREKASSDSYINFLKKKGVNIGNGTKFYNPRTTNIDITRPFLINIGENVQITSGVTILTHGYDWSVIKSVYGEVLGSSGKVNIGNNVFIGVNTTILKGVSIGNNVIIGANSLVNKDIPDNSIVAGNPAKFIMNLEEYYKKRQKLQFNEAKELAQEYYKKYKVVPDKSLFREFFWLFEERYNSTIDEFNDVLKLQNNYEESIKIFRNTKPMFKSYEEFIRSCDIKI